ncbi:MAG: flavin reductase family protein [Solirubrobacteraceae bacterium]
MDPQTFRHVLGHLPTGVVVITSSGEDGSVAGLACNSLTSVSLDPPLVLFCPARTSETWPLIRDAGAFCVNVMSEPLADVTLSFARKGIDRFAGIDQHERSGGPGLDAALAWLDCRIRDVHEAGDHFIVVAEVVTIDVSASESVNPLVFYRGCYGTFAGRETERKAS